MVASKQRFAFVGFLTVGSVAKAQSQSARTSTEVGGRCEFDNEPIGIGSFWDPSCEMGMLGCKGDGRNTECRMCGGGNFSSVSCPPSSCHFPHDPFVPYYWDNDCVAGMLGCWADGIHAQCRFCGDYPYTGVTCPEGAAAPPAASCAFDIEPETPYFWDASCFMGKHGCNADGENVHCRFCGAGDYVDIHCPGSHVCEFAVIPTVPYYWDPNCTDGMLGCKADGVNPQCRFCAERPFENVTCPVQVPIPENTCHWPQRGEPNVPHFWDEACEMGMLGCWADGIHAQCRFCGQGVFRDIACPNGTDSQATGPLLL